MSEATPSLESKATGFGHHSEASMPGGSKQRRNLSSDQTSQVRAWLTAICKEFGLKRASLAKGPGEKRGLSGSENMPITVARDVLRELLMKLVPEHLSAEQWSDRVAGHPVIWSLVSFPIYREALPDADLRALGDDPKAVKKHALSHGEILEYRNVEMRDGKPFETPVDVAEFRRQHAPRLPMLLPSAVVPALARVLVEMLASEDFVSKAATKPAMAALETRLAAMVEKCGNAFALEFGRFIDLQGGLDSLIADSQNDASAIAPDQAGTMLLFAIARYCTAPI
jgi:hypothetical protein